MWYTIFEHLNGRRAKMKQYEAVWEIFNLCSGNQMRDVLIEEIDTDDVEEYVKNKFKGEEFSYEKSVLEDGSIVFDIMTSKIKQRYTFTEI
jgi:hypothetical protein